MKLREGERQKKKYLPIENRDEEDVVLHGVLLLKENFRRYEVVRVRKKNNTSMVFPKKKLIFRLLKKKLIFKSSKVQTMKS